MIRIKGLKCAIIKDSMQLDEKRSEEFWLLCHRFDVEQTELGDEKFALIQDYAHE